MGIFELFQNGKERARKKSLEKEQKLLDQQFTARATVVEVLTNYTEEWRDNPCDLTSGDMVLVDEYWTKPVVKYIVGGIEIRSEEGKPGEWIYQCKNCPYKVGDEVIVRFNEHDHDLCRIICKCKK